MRWLRGVRSFLLGDGSHLSSSATLPAEPADIPDNLSVQTEVELPSKVDVAVCVYGKPVQTAVTLASLFEHSGRYIDKVYFLEEAKQPHGVEVEAIARLFPERNIIHFKPKMHLGVEFSTKERLSDQDYRQSLRYQYAWECSDKKFIFIIHNDCLFSDDIIGGMLAKLESGTFTGVGMIGQCWNCPASHAGLCSGDTYDKYKPTYEEAAELLTKFPAPRTFEWNIDRETPMPLPECRLNEFACLINLDMARPATVPFGDTWPFGAMTTDIGTAWFRGLVLKGHRFLNWSEGLHHAYFSVAGNGFALDNNKTLYDASEQKALDYCIKHYPKLGQDLFAIGSKIASGGAVSASEKERMVKSQPNIEALKSADKRKTINKIKETSGGFFRIKTYHGSILAVRPSGHIVNVRPDIDHSYLLPAVAYVTSSEASNCFLMAEVPSGVALNLAPQRVVGAIVPLRMTQKASDGTLSLYSPETGAFMTVVPTDKDTGEGHVALAAKKIQAWEQLQFEALVDSELLPAWGEVASILDTLGLSESNPELMVQAIERCSKDTMPTDVLKDVLNAVGLLLSPEQMAALADVLLSRGQKISSAFEEIFKDNIYAQYAIPSVLGKLSTQRDNNIFENIAVSRLFLKKKGKGNRGFFQNRGERPAHRSRQALANSAFSQRKTIGTEFDFLANENVSAKYLSLPASLNRQLRRSVRPSQRACIIATARNEGLYLLEWVSYHRAIGFDQIFVYSNDNDDGSDELLEALHNCGAITWIQNIVAEGTPAQRKAYGHALRISPDALDYEWTLIIDLDEFFVPDATFGNVRRFLDWHEARPVDAIAISCRIVASNGESYWRDDLLSRRFPFACSGIDRHVKTIFRTKNFVHSYPHDPTPSWGQLDNFRHASGETYESEPGWGRSRAAHPNDRNAIIAHYFYKSNEEMIWKSARNRGDDSRRQGFTLGGLRASFISALIRHASGDEMLPIAQYIPDTQRKIADLLTQPAIAKAFDNVKMKFRETMPGLIEAAGRHPAMAEAAEDGIAFMMPFKHLTKVNHPRSIREVEKDFLNLTP